MDRLQSPLPDPLVFANHRPVQSASDWSSRRQELMELFRHNVYGRVPAGNVEANYEVVEDEGPILSATRRITRIRLRGRAGETSFSVASFGPKQAEPSPAFLLLCNRGATDIDPNRETRSPFWPVEEIVARGYAAAAVLLDTIAPDGEGAFREGVFRLFDETRGDDTWGVIGAWAWGASRVLDALRQDPRLDPRRIAVVGHSRGGKAALWAGAQDERFAMAISNESGCTGAALARRTRGERVADINRLFPHWFCLNYRGFGEREEDLPVDQHELLALLAPRSVYVASAEDDSWADPRAEFAACVAADPVYRMLGLGGLTDLAFPTTDRTIHGGSIGYHVRTGSHNLTPLDWHRFMDFADLPWRECLGIEPS